MQIFQFNAELNMLHEQKLKKQKLEAELKDLAAQRDELKNKAAGLYAELCRANRAAEKLDTSFFTKFRHKLKGDYRAQLEKARSKAREAITQHSSAKAQLAETQARISECILKLRPLASCEMKYRELLQQKQAYLREHDPASAAEIERLEQAQCSLADLQKALARVTAAAHKSLESAADAEALLNGAAKRRAIMKAKAATQNLKSMLDRLNAELLDFALMAELSAQMYGLHELSDWCFDGVFSDTNADGISDLQAYIAGARREIEGVLDKLSEKRRQIISAQAAVQEKLSELVLKA